MPSGDFKMKMVRPKAFYGSGRQSRGHAGDFMGFAPEGLNFQGSIDDLRLPLSDDVWKLSQRFNNEGYDPMKVCVLLDLWKAVHELEVMCGLGQE